ncbi:MAG: hypothetical protein GEU28_04280 [Dehalococcoidia bacterium]|nr:hypothetical protein [Dehalococcoidia bacterium]
MTREDMARAAAERRTGHTAPESQGDEKRQDAEARHKEALRREPESLDPGGHSTPQGPGSADRSAATGDSVGDVVIGEEDKPP